MIEQYFITAFLSVLNMILLLVMWSDIKFIARQITNLEDD